MNLLDELRRDFGFTRDVVYETIGNHTFGFRVPSSADVSALAQLMEARGRADLNNVQAALSVCSIDSRPLYEVFGIEPSKLGYSHIENSDYPPLPVRHAAMREFVKFIDSDNILPAFRFGLNALYLTEVDAKYDIEIPYFLKRDRYECREEGCGEDKVKLPPRNGGYHCHFCGKPMVKVSTTIEETLAALKNEDDEDSNPFSQTPTSQQ